MKIIDFDIKKGIYDFALSELVTENHSHPVIEIIVADTGTFQLEVNNIIKKDLSFAVIDSNVKHKINSEDGVFRILMIESHNLKLSDFLESKLIVFENGFFVRTVFNQGKALMKELKNLALDNDLKTPTDSRILQCIKFIEENELEYKNLILKLTSLVYLSNSRLSHLFKEQIGVSIKKYLVWNKLKRAINLYLEQGTNLTDASFMSGFFDQAHLSNSFKSILGLSPSKAYNSRILQS